MFFFQMWVKKYRFGQKTQKKYLVISRADKMIHLCEMKFSATPYTIKKEYAEWLSKRKQLFMEENNISRGVVLTFVTPYGLKEGLHTSLVHSSLSAKELFLAEG